MLQEWTFDTGQAKINLAEGPASGPPLVLLHGGGDRWQDFLPILPSLALRWHLFALDFRGHGGSGRVPGHYRPEHYAADVDAFVTRQFTEPVTLFGHSLGGWIALLVAAQRADKMAALVLGDPPLNMERFLTVESGESRVRMWQALRDLVASSRSVPELAAALATLPVGATDQGEPLRYGDLPGVDAVHLRGWAKTLRQADPDAVQYHASGRIHQYVANIDLEAALRQVTCSTLLLQADPIHGGIIADEDVPHILSLLAEGVHVKLEGVGHDLGLGSWRVAPLLRAIFCFLESL